MPRILKLLLPLALFLGLPFLLDARVTPSTEHAGAGMSGSAAQQGGVTRYRYFHYDPDSGALVFELRGDRAVQVATPGESRQKRFTLEGLWIRMAQSPKWGGGFMPLELTAPAGAVRFGEGGDTLVNLEGGVRGTAQDGTTLTTAQVRLTVAERSGLLSEAAAPSAVQVRGPGVVLDAAGATYEPEQGWLLTGPVSGSLRDRELPDAQATAELDRSVLGLHAPQGLRLVPDADSTSYTLYATGGLYLDRRAVVHGPIQSFIGGREVEVQLQHGVVTAVRVRNDLRAAAVTDDGNCGAVVAAAAGEWTPATGELQLSGRPRWYMRAGSTLWIPGEAIPKALPEQRLGPNETPGGWMASAQRRMTIRRDDASGAVELQLRDQAMLAAVPLVPGHAATRALAPIPEAARADAYAFAAYLANRNLLDAPGRSDGEVRAHALDAVVHPREGIRQVVDFDARDAVDVRGAGPPAVRAAGGRARGQFTSERTVRTVAAELHDDPDVRVTLADGRVVQLRGQQPASAIAFEGRSAGARREAKVVASDGVKLFDLRGERVAGTWRADRATLELRRGDEQMTSLLLQGSVNATTLGQGGERSEVRLDELRAVRTLGLKGKGRDLWTWRGLESAQAPAAVLFDLAPNRNDWSLPGSPGSRWSLQGSHGRLDRWLRQAGKQWVPVKTIATLVGPSTVAFKPAAAALSEPGFTLSPRDGATLAFVHQPDVSGKNAFTTLVSVDLPNGGTYRSDSAQVSADRISMSSSPEAQSRTWTLDGAPAVARFRAGAPLPFTTSTVPGGNNDDGDDGDDGNDGTAPAPWFDGRAKHIVITQTFTDALFSTVAKETVQLTGDPVLGQLPAGTDAGPDWPVPEWELRSGGPLWLERTGAVTIVRGRDGVRLANYDAFGVRQALMRAPGVVVESTAGGATEATFEAPFVAEGVTGAAAYAALGEAGGAGAGTSKRVRLISREPVIVRRESGSDTLSVATPTLNVLPLDDSGAPLRAVAIPQGVRITPGADESWTFAFLGANAAAVPLEASELEELAKLAKGG